MTPKTNILPTDLVEPEFPQLRQTERIERVGYPLIAGMTFGQSEALERTYVRPLAKILQDTMGR